jgi:mono/diheme cytochrome c family protein
VTEIPEHLLKRSQAAKSKATGEAAPAADLAAATAPAEASNAPVPAGAAAAPAKAAAAVPAVAPPPPPVKPDPPFIAAAKNRAKVPFWAMMTLSLLPLWAFMYVRGLTPKEPKVTGPLGEGSALYVAGCSGCHGANGQGGVGYQFAGGEVLKTFPHIEDQLRFVYAGTDEYAAEGISIPGNPDRPGGPHLTGAKGVMPAQGEAYSASPLTEPQILAVVCHERFTLGGATPTDNAEEYEKWCSPEAAAWVGLESGALTFDNIADNLEGTFPVGTKPLAGQPADAKP